MKVNLNEKCLVGGLKRWCEFICHYFGSDLTMMSHCNALVPSNCYHRYYKLKEANDKTTLNLWLFPDNEDIEAICRGIYSLSQRPTMIIPRKRRQPRRRWWSPGRRRHKVLTHKLCGLRVVTAIWRKNRTNIMQGKWICFNYFSLLLFLWKWTYPNGKWWRLMCTRELTLWGRTWFLLSERTGGRALEFDIY